MSFSEPAIRSRNASRCGVRITAMAVLATLVILTGMGFTYQMVSREHDERRYQAPGELVDGGGFRMHLNALDEPTDGPTVILEQGDGSFSPQWGWVQPGVEEFARAVAYDRPGLGWSESSPEPLDAVEEAAMLRLALEELGISGPYVFVGHSMGALMARSFAALCPDEVVGMVLVDPRPVSWGVVCPDGAPEANELEFRLISLAARFGIIRFIGFTDEVAKGLPLRQFEEGMAKMNTGRHFTESVRDGELGVSAITVIEERERLDDMPVIVLSAGQPDAAFDDDVRTRSTAARADIAELTPNGQHGVVPGTNHFTIVSREDKVQHTADAVRELVEQGGEGNTELEGGRMRARPGTVHVTPVLAPGHAALCFCGADSVRGHRRPLL